MLARQFLTLALSALIGFTPINFSYYDGDEIEFPLSRRDSVYWRLSYDIDDLGPLVNNSSNHDYGITYNYMIECSSPCRIEIPDAAAVAQVSTNYYTFSILGSMYNVTPTAMLQVLETGNKGGTVSEGYTYQTQNSVHRMDVTLEHGSGSWVLHVFFSPLNEGNLLSSILHQTEELNNWYFLKNFLMDKDVPVSDIQTIKNYIDNGDYSSAIQYVENYYISNAVNQNTTNENVVNNYDTHETNLQTVSNQEHQFTVGIENQFENQIRLLDPTNSVIDNVSWQQSAVWVTDKFNRFTNGNAFGSLLGFSLLIGFAMAIIGRVLK